MENNNTNNNFAVRKAIEELVKGREFANQLKHLINGGGGGGGGGGGANGGDNGGDGEQLVRKVLMSFTNSLLILRYPSSEFQEAPSLTRINPTNSEDSLESNCKSSSTTKERRGCYKRRRTSQSWEKESETLIEDGHQWRKYGQKVILNAKHPRNYYRCTHKYDQGCQATKQVQRIQDEPSPLFKTTYYGNHTCRNFLMNPEIILDSNEDNDSPNNNNTDKTSSVFLSFGINKQDFTTRFLTSNNFPTATMVKEEYKEEINNPSLSSSDDYNNLLSSELTFDNYSNHVTTTLSPNLDPEDVISGALYDPSEFDDAFELFF